MNIYVDFTDVEQRVAFDSYIGNSTLSADYINEGTTQMVFNNHDGSIQAKVKRGEYFESINDSLNIENIKQLKKIKELL